MNRLIVILGPTAVGKTALSFSLADYFHGEIISGDAYQIYRRMDIGTAKATQEELRRYPHHLINIAEPDEPYSAARFCAMAGNIIRSLHRAGRIPILAGGTGLYVQALLEGYHFDGERVDEGDREKVKNKMASFSQEELKAYIVSQTDWQPPDWHELFSNTHRLVRLMAAIEKGEGREFVRSGKDGLVYPAYVIGLSLPRDVLYERINRRVDLMIQSGWPDEVRSLLSDGISLQCQSMKAIGYEEMAAYVQGRMTMDEAAERIKARTRRFAKRQMTWYRRMPYIHWFAKDSYSSDKALSAAIIADIERVMHE